MDQQPQDSSSQPFSVPPETAQPASEPVADSREARREMRRERHANDAWIWGILLILGGGLLLLNNFTTFHLNNWWALFILIPAFTSFSSAWGHYRSAGMLNAAARSNLIGGVVFLVVALIFLLNLSFGNYWPVFLVLGGVALLLNSLLKD